MVSSRQKYARAALVIALIIKRKRKRRNKRRVWVKEWILQRKRFGVYATLLPELTASYPKMYTNFLRMSATNFQELLSKIYPLIKKEDTVMRESIQPGERLAVTLRFLASGDSYHSLSYLFRIPVQTISKIIPECCDAIYSSLQSFVKVPNTTDEWKQIASHFDDRWNFPNCVGALDGKHVVIQKPKNSGSIYYNYKGTFSIVLMALVDADCKFIYFDIGCNGRISDGGVFRNCSLSKALETNSINLPEMKPLTGRNTPVPYVIVGDDAFPLSPNIMKPYPYKSQPGPNRVFNYRLSRARRTSENAFGLISNRFRLLRNAIMLEPEKAKSAVRAVIALHNFLLTKNSLQRYAPPDVFDRSAENGDVLLGTWRNDVLPDNLLFSLQSSSSGHNVSNACKKIRDEFKDYFVSSHGEVPWQYKFI